MYSYKVGYYKLTNNFSNLSLLESDMLSNFLLFLKVMNVGKLFHNVDMIGLNNFSNSNLLFNLTFTNLILFLYLLEYSVKKGLMSLQGLQPEVIEINRITGIFDDCNIVSNCLPEVMLVILLLKKTKYNEIMIMIMIMIVVFIYKI